MVHMTIILTEKCFTQNFLYLKFWRGINANNDVEEDNEDQSSHGIFVIDVPLRGGFEAPYLLKAKLCVEESS